MARVEIAGLRVDSAMAAFLDTEVLGPLGLDTGAFWRGLAGLVARFTPRNRELLAVRERMQQQIDGWHRERRGQDHDPAACSAFLHTIGYLLPEPAPFTIADHPADPEVAATAAPQLVVPVLNARYLLNAANARWGSLYDAWYGTDALGDLPVGDTYDRQRGARVIAAGRAFLDRTLPLRAGSWADLPDADAIRLADPGQACGTTQHGLLFRNNGLHIELVIDRAHPIGQDDRAGIADIRLEAALTTIVDLEDSVAAVDAADKLAAYRNWLGVIRGDLIARFDKGGDRQIRQLEGDLTCTGPDGHPGALGGRSLLFVRNVGLLMTSDAVLLSDGSEIPEGLLDAVVTAAIGALDVRGLTRWRNSAVGAIYIVKPKLHGPDECAFVDEMMDAVEDLLELPRHTVRLGLMDEERRTSANLAACIHALRQRIVFINTGFLDRTGDEIHTAMQAGPVVRKAAMKQARWLDAYERRNVAAGLACGLGGRAQIGKGMWAAPDRMAAMLAEKGAHLAAGATTAWVPSPTAAVLHALHYHEADVFAIQRTLAEAPGREALLTPPLADGGWSRAEIAEELENNCQSLLGYVVRWIDAGIGCSKVPDIADVGLMEDRATLRISSQHIANWLLHGVVTREEVLDTLRRMAVRVDRQNAADAAYRPMAPAWRTHPAFQAACELVFDGATQPSGYTEPILHRWRRQTKRRRRKIDGNRTGTSAFWAE
ncbi:malate synthase G [Croceibacterium mercuriale]|uniref:malate synthase G n=1 Tax=Croceibacterium mercuriale TaxID=1572751 RepID=UPI00068B5214|nr:malate synthase G [Croceibacterium mercuriale]